MMKKVIQRVVRHRYVAAALVCSLGVSVAARGEGQFQALSFDKALAQAAQANRLVFIDFYTTWCGPCKMLDQTTFKDAWVREWLAGKAVALKVDAEKDTQLAEKFKVEGYPTLLFLDGKGKVIERQVGYVTPQEFRALAQDLDKGVTALDRAKLEVEKNPNAPRAHLDLATALARQERYDEALKEYLWCLDEGAAKDAAFAEERDGRLLEGMLMQAGVHEKTLDELVRRRDAAKRRLLDDQPKPGDAALFVAVSQVTADPEELLATYDAATSRGRTSPAAQALAKPLFPVLLDAKRYEQITQARDLSAEGDDLLRRGQTEVDAYRKADPNVDDGALSMVKARWVAQVAQYFQALLGAGRGDAAQALADRTLAFDKSPDTYHALAWEGFLSGKPSPKCLEYGQIALEKSPAEERANVIDTVARLMHALGRTTEAVALCEKALADAQDDRQRWVLSTCLAEIQPAAGGQ